MSKQVLFIYFQTGDQANGGTESMSQIALNLSGNKPQLLTQKDTQLNKRLEQAGMKLDVHRVRHGGKLMRIIGVIRFNYKVWCLMRHSDVDVVHINDIRALMHSFLGVKLAGKRMVFNIRDVYERHIPYPIHWMLVNFSNHIIVLSQEMQNSLLNRLPLINRNKWTSKFSYSYSIVDHSKYHAINERERARLHNSIGFVNKDVINVAYVAGFNDKKNQLTFLKQTVGKLDGLNIHFIGDCDMINNPYAKECYEYIIKENLNEFVTIHGFKSNVENYYQACDITIVPTKREGLARCMIESLACGTPVVSFDVSSAHEILTEQSCGVVVPQGDYKRLLNEVRLLAADQERYQLYKANGVALTRELFNKETVVAHYEQVYQQLKSK